MMGWEKRKKQHPRRGGGPHIYLNKKKAEEILSCKKVHPQQREELTSDQPEMNPDRCLVESDCYEEGREARGRRTFNKNLIAANLSKGERKESPSRVVGGGSCIKGKKQSRPSGEMDGMAKTPSSEDQ